MNKKAEMRIAIVKDVLKQIAAKKYVPTLGTYLYTARELKQGDLQSQIPKLGKCEVCALGSLFISHVRLNDDFEVRRSIWPESCPRIVASEMHDALATYFGLQTLTNIENTFEGFFEERGELLNTLCVKLKPTKLLVFICEEIIRQNGNFNLAKVEKSAAKLLKEKQ